MVLRAVLSLALAAALALPALFVPALAQVRKAELAGVRNYSKVDATVGCAGATDASAMTALKAEGYVAVVNLRLPTEQGADVEGGRAAAQAAGLKYFHSPFNTATPDPSVVSKFLATLADKSNQPVFIHCGSANRVGGMWMIKRVLQDKWPIDQARTEAEAIGLREPAMIAFVTEYINSHK
jgi:uncharacterized protein (TIGR01244 family)